MKYRQRAVYSRTIMTNNGLRELYQKCDQALEVVPDQLQYRQDARWDDALCTLLIHQAKLRLEYLQSRFLIGRLAMARGLGDYQRLLDSAMEMMDMTVMFWVKRDVLLRHTSQFDWFVSQTPIK